MDEIEAQTCSSREQTKCKLQISSGLGVALTKPLTILYNGISNSSTPTRNEGTNFCVIPYLHCHTQNYTNVRRTLRDYWHDHRRREHGWPQLLSVNFRPSSTSSGRLEFLALRETRTILSEHKLSFSGYRLRRPPTTKRCCSQ